MRLPTVKGRVGMGRTTIYEKIKEGSFPKPVSIGDRSVAWDSFEIDKWIEQKIGEGK
jgi:prophage regulatory protein